MVLPLNSKLALDKMRIILLWGWNKNERKCVVAFLVLGHHCSISREPYCSWTPTKISIFFFVPTLFLPCRKDIAMKLKDIS